MGKVTTHSLFSGTRTADQLSIASHSQRWQGGWGAAVPTSEGHRTFDDERALTVGIEMADDY
jgi:hypothetical protein